MDAEDASSYYNRAMARDELDDYQGAIASSEARHNLEVAVDSLHHKKGNVLD